MTKWVHPGRVIAEPDRFSEAQIQASIADNKIRLNLAANATMRKHYAKMIRDLEKALASKRV